MIHGIVKINKTHLKSEPMIKFTTVIEPIELIPARPTIINAPGKRVRKDLTEIKIINKPVVKM